MLKIAITDYVHPNLISGLENLGFIVDYNTKFTTDSLFFTIHEYAGIIINSKIKANKRFIERAVNLRFIARLGSGLDIIDLDMARKKHIHVINAPEGNCNAVAEHTISMLLCLLNKINVANQEVKSFHWLREKNRGNELAGQTLGIIGFGHTGSSLASKLKCWQMDIMTYDKYNPDLPKEFSYVKSVSLKELQNKADIISFHVPLTEETHYYLDEEFVANCKKTPILINTSRGKVFSVNALIKALKNENIAGACLDVLENENPLSYSMKKKNTYKQLFHFENVILTPHIAGWTHESLRKIADITHTRIAALNLT